MSVSCPGFASYTVHPSGLVEVNGATPSFKSGSVQVEKLLDAWGRFQGPVSETSERTGVPVPWIMAIMMAESGGDPRACSPCSVCRSELCASGAGMQCCAFGLMQFIRTTAIQYGTNPTEIVQNPAIAIAAAGDFLSDLAERLGLDLPRIAAAYNGGLGVLSKCGKEGSTFGWQTNHDYPMHVVRYSNTAVALGLRPVASRNAGLVLATLIGAGLAWGVYTDRIRI